MLTKKYICRAQARWEAKSPLAGIEEETATTLSSIASTIFAPSSSTEEATTASFTSSSSMLSPSSCSSCSYYLVATSSSTFGCAGCFAEVAISGATAMVADGLSCFMGEGDENSWLLSAC
ncbi:hypothetical protein P8452_43351 [Trifolium repens]|nr:hypothetical protein P8452_43351 [Trifolium repens]